MHIKKAEVLSPVGSYESLEAAVRSGADAVYMGAKEFSARRNAENFDNNTLAAAVEYCHIRGVKAYLTLNIMIKQSELERALETAGYAYRAGIDALIIQDLGIASLIHKAYPELELHASTQMSVHSPAALPSLKRMSFSRVVASREMSREELREFCAEAQKLQMEVEVFVHGALCMCVSGQCLLSSVLGARSGNRGLCAGPCRLPFEATGGTGYDLSLKDLSLIDYISELTEMGVASLKIEGRMKRPEYIAAATAACRQAVDNITPDKDIINALSGVFSRSGFTDGYYKSRLGRDMFGIRTKDDVTASKETFAFLHKLYRGERQSVGVSIRAIVKADCPIKLYMSDGLNDVCVEGDIPERAQRTSVDVKSVSDNLVKLGGTPYLPTRVEVDLDDGLFVRGAQLNELRRNAVDALNSARSTVMVGKEQTADFNFVDTTHRDKPYIIARFESEQDIPHNLKADAVILPMNCNFTVSQKPIIVEAPRYITNENKLLSRLKSLKEQGIEYAYCHSIAAIEIAVASGLSVIASPSLNTANSATVEVLSSMGAKAVTLSAEISAREIRTLPTKFPKGIFAYGRLPLMLLRNCPFKNGRQCADCDKKGTLRDRKGIEFPVACRGDHCELLNSMPIYLADKLSDFSGVDFMVLSFTDETKEQTEEIISAYKNGGTPPVQYTRGLYFRDLI